MISRQWVFIASVKRVSQCCALTVLSSFLLACSSAPQASGGLINSALEMVGLQKFEPPTSMTESGQLKTNAPLNRPGIRGGCLVKVKPGIRSSRRVADSSLLQPRLVEYTQLARAVGDD